MSPVSHRGEAHDSKRNTALNVARHPRRYTASYLWRLGAWCLVGIWALLGSAPAGSAFAAAMDETPEQKTEEDLDQYRRRQEAKTQEKEAQARMQLADADAMEALQRAVAKANSLDSQRRSAAEKEREFIEASLPALERRLAARKWAVQNFDPDFILPSSRAPGQYVGLGKVFEYYMTESDSASQRRSAAVRSVRETFAGRSSAMRGAIRSGRALNALLELLGPAAVEHQRFRDAVALESAREGVEAALAADAIPNNVTADEIVTQRIALLDQVAGPRVLTKAELENVRVQSGLGGPKIVIRINDEPLPLDWPWVLRHDERYTPLLQAVEDAKRGILEELHGERRENSRMTTSIESQSRLLEAIDNLCIRFEGDVEQFIEEMRELNKSANGPSYGKLLLDLTRARAFLQEMRYGATRLIEAQQPADVIMQFPPDERPVTIQEFIAFLDRENLRFTAAQTNDESTYELLFEEMMSYAVKLEGLKASAFAEQQELLGKKEEIDKLLKEQLGPLDQQLVDLIESSQPD